MSMTDFTTSPAKRGEHGQARGGSISAAPARALSASCAGLFKTLELEVGKEKGAERHLGVTHAIMFINDAAAVCSQHDGEPARWRSSSWGVTTLISHFCLDHPKKLCQMFPLPAEDLF